MNASLSAPPGLVAQRLIAVPWRHAGLIVLFALAGGLASATFWPHAAPPRVAMAHVHAIQDAHSAPAPGMRLRLDQEPGAAVLAVAAVRIAVAAQASSSLLRLDDADVDAAIDAALRGAPPAAGRAMPPTPALAPAGAERPRASLPGLVTGLLMGLLVAALRELGGQRMRSPREAQWALGAPILGAIPTLSAKARDALAKPSLAA